MKKPLASLFALLLAAQSASAAVISTARVIAPISGVSGAIGTQGVPLHVPFAGPNLGQTPLLVGSSLILNQTPVIRAETAADPAITAPIAAASLQAPKALTVALPKRIPVLPAAQTPLAPLSQLSAGVKLLGQAAQNDVSGTKAGAVLSELFQGQTKQAELGTVTPQIPGGKPTPSNLQPSTQASDVTGRPAADIPTDQQKPRSSLARTFKAGFLGAVVPLLITNVAITVALALGYQLHPNYSTPAGEVAGLAATAMFGVMAAVVAPISEEVVFRKGIMGLFQKAFKKISGEAGAFWIPAILSSLIFVAVHETADPLLFATRFIHSMIISRVFYKEGLPASMAAHGFFNGLLTLPMLLVALLGPTAGGIATLAVTPISLLLALRFWKQLKAQRPERKSGALVNVEVTRKAAFTMAASLMAAFLLLMPNPIWIAGAVGLAIYGFSKKQDHL